MRKELWLLLILYFVLFIVCNDAFYGCETTIYGKWQVKEFLSVESVLYAKDNVCKPVIEFKNEGTIEICLDVNQCFSDFELLAESGIRISDIAGTKACCDSDFSLKLITMLPEVVTYELEDDDLKLIVPGWGWILLEKFSK
jgi:hypothetical protein